jgi:hypothetical protein
MEAAFSEAHSARFVIDDSIRLVRLQFVAPLSRYLRKRLGRYEGM